MSASVLRVLAPLVLVALVVMAGCTGNSKGDGRGPTDDGTPTPASTSFIAIGDAGMGNAMQTDVATAVTQICATRPCDFAVGLGDNIYPSGAESPTDPQFESKFEQPYANLTFPFWMVLGNHDNGQNPTGAPAAEGGLGLWYSAGNHEVAYSQRTDRTSEKWQMPARHYTFSHGDVDFLALDTNTFMWYGAPVGPELAAEIQAQETWLPGAAAALNHTWRIGLGHHPYLSNSEHGNAGEYDGDGSAGTLALVPGKNGDHFKQVFDEHLCDVLDVYLAGHDHALQWLKPTAACGKTQFLVSGGGGAGLYDIVGTEDNFFQESKNGFFWIQIAGSTLTATAFNEAAQELYTGTLTKAA